jgi:hypothetical protein
MDPRKREFIILSEMIWDISRIREIMMYAQKACLMA